MCSSFQTGTKLLSDTNVAVITSTIATGHFDLEATIIPQNNTGRDELPRKLPATKENVIHLGHTQNELDIIFKLLHPPKSKSLSENLSTNTSDGFIIVGESEDPDYYEDYSNADSKEDLKNQKNKLNRPYDPIFNYDLNSKLNNGKNMLNHKVNQLNQPMNNQFHHQKNGTPLQKEDQLSHILNIDFLQENGKLNPEAYHPVSNQMIHQQNHLPNPLTGYQLVTNQPNLELNQAVNQPKENTVNHQSVKHLIRHESANQNIQLHQPLNNPVENLFSQQHKSLSSQHVKQQAGNQFTHQNSQLNEPVNHSMGNQQNVKLHPTENEQQNGKMSHIIDHTLENQFIPEENEHLNQPTMNHLAENYTNQHQNDHRDQPTNLFNNPKRSEITYHLNQPQNQLISHIINQLRGTHNFVHQPNHLHQGTGDHAIQQTDLTNQLVDKLLQLKVQKKYPSNKLHNFQQNGQMKQLMNLLNPAAENQVQGQENLPSSELANFIVHPMSTQLSKQNVHIGPLATQSIQPASIQFIQQENDQSKQSVDRFHSYIHPQYTQSSQSMDHLIHTMNNQVTQQKNEPQIPMDVVINSASNHFTDTGKSNKIENNLMHLIHNKVTDQKIDQTNQYVNKLIHSQINETDDYQKIISQPSIHQFSGYDKFYEHQIKTASPILNIIFDQSNPLKDVPPEKQLMLPVINHYRNISGNQTIYRENSKFTNNTKKHISPHIRK